MGETMVPISPRAFLMSPNQAAFLTDLALWVVLQAPTEAMRARDCPRLLSSAQLLA